MDATIGINPVVARSENKLLSFRNTEKKELSFPRNVDFPPATNAALLSTISSLPKFSHLRNSHGGGNNFRSKAASARFLSAKSVSFGKSNLECDLGSKAEPLSGGSPVHVAKFHSADALLPIQWNNHLSSAENKLLLSQHSSCLEQIFDGKHSSPAAFTVSQSPLFSERAPDSELPALDTWSLCKTSDCSNLCGPLNSYPLYLQRKVRDGRLLLPTHCVDCLRTRALTRIVMPQVANAVLHTPAAPCDAPRVARSLAAHPGNRQETETCRLACLLGSDD